MELSLRFSILCVLLCSLCGVSFGLEEDDISSGVGRRLYAEIFRSLQHLTRERPDYEAFEEIKRSIVESSKGQSGAQSIEDLPYFKILPGYKGVVALNSTLDISGSCFEDAWAESVYEDMDGSVHLDIHLAQPNGLLCHVSFIVATDSYMEVMEIWTSGVRRVTFSPPRSPAEEWDLYGRGPRIFMYPISPETVTYNLAATALLFEPVLTEAVGETFAGYNREFLLNYAGIDMQEREAPDILEIPAELIKDGDTFNIMRLDGLDPMIAWAMGAATGHTAVALWRDGDLFVCESNAKSAYWPVNGVQCNPYLDWMEYGRRNGYNVVWAPLKEEIRSSLNITAAWQFVDSMLGIDYGWEVVLMGLLDTLTENMPCAGAGSTMCIEPEQLELVFSYMERHSTVAARVFKPAMMQRAGVPFDRPIVEAYHQAWLNKVSPEELYTLPEQDGWLYPTTRYGEPEDSIVAICNVFVCNVWKAAGLFGAETPNINCGETSVNDNYKLRIYEDADKRPGICKELDPNNPNCQVLGKYELRLDSQPGQLPRYNYVDISPHMFESCPSQYPDYLAPPTC